MPGLTNTSAANLTLISGFPPPLCYSVYKDPVNCTHGVEPLRDYEEALALAKKLHKPILIDFTGWACVNCPSDGGKMFGQIRRSGKGCWILL
ncbi:MAG: hypothetical protein WDM78_23730 [Puia sp.]